MKSSSSFLQALWPADGFAELRGSRCSSASATPATWGTDAHRYYRA
jgi:hypothetical protein